VRVKSGKACSANRNLTNCCNASGEEDKRYDEVEQRSSAE
jgi:hypothetical protein